MSEYHMSYDQAISALVTVGKRMFGLDWRMFEEGDTITIDTMPEKRMNRKMGKALEAFTLSQLVNLMMDEQEKTTVTYHDDGSRSKADTLYRKVLNPSKILYERSEIMTFNF